MLDAFPAAWYSSRMKAFYVYLAVINVLTFLIYGYDKLAAKRKWRRIPEIALLALAVIGGSIGAECAILLFRHKTRHRAFALGVPVILVIQIIGLFLYAVLS